MKLRGFIKKYQNEILPAGLLIIIGIVVAVRFDYYYALNDDVMIKDIISGNYTGIAEARDNQMLYPLSLVLSLIYQVCPVVPWFGIFLWLCHFGCLYLMLRRSLSFCNDITVKIIICVTEGILFAGIFLEHFVFAQYTITSGLLAATAVFLFVTEQDTERLLVKSVPCILLAVLSFLLRSEMLLLMLPFICVAGVYKWSREEKIFSVPSLRKYFGVFSCILGGLFVALVIDSVAYSGTEWKDFRAFFDARTTLYDYTGVPLYEGNEDIYEEIGLSKEQYALLTSYNYALDNALDASAMESLAEYAGDLQAGLFSQIKMGLVRYRYRITNMDGYPYNLIVVLGYVLVFLALKKKNKVRLAFVTVLLLGIRSVVWVYILMTNRIPLRITHPLYFAEFILLAAICLMEWRDAAKSAERVEREETVNVQLIGNKSSEKMRPETLKGLMGIGVCLLIGLFGTYNSYKETVLQTEVMVDNNRASQALYDYCAEHPEDFFFMDVYSSIYFSERLFANRQQVANYELLGGWICKSPLYEKKLAAYGIDSPEEAFKSMDNIYLVQDINRSFDWIVNYYAQRGCQVNPVEVTVFDEWLGVYQLEVRE